MTDACKTEIYPRYCFHLSSTANTWCFLPARVIHTLQQHAGFEGENFFFHKNLPIKWARIVGCVVAIDEFSGRHVFTLDDSSGKCIEAWIFDSSHAPEPASAVASEAAAAKENKSAKDTMRKDLVASPAYSEIDIGHVIDVKGSLCSFRGEMQIKIEKFSSVKGTAQEMMLWKKRSKFQRDVLDKPWVLDAKIIRRCRKEAEASSLSEKRREKRHHASAKSALKGKESAEPPRAQVPETGQSRKKEKKQTSAEVAAQLKQLILDGSVKGKYGALGL
ncbi:hypothetical protein E4U50_000489 [Claviceps purpurea]|nr:hypothetical protein E4U50_000489 [Claviceps purpurea]